jgi:ABC-type nitrate/sulfonate/bicarbonate transport system ATPase subunit
MWSEYGWTVLLVTHDVREAVYLSDKIYVFSPRPATVVECVPVPLPRPRDLGSPEFAALEGKLLDLLLSEEDKVDADLAG